MVKFSVLFQICQKIIDRDHFLKPEHQCFMTSGEHVFQFIFEKEIVSKSPIRCRENLIARLSMCRKVKISFRLRLSIFQKYAPAKISLQNPFTFRSGLIPCIKVSDIDINIENM